MKRLKILLSYNTFYYLLLFICFIFLIVYNIFFKVKHVYDLGDNSFYIKIKNYKIDGNKLTIYSDYLVCNYYFKTEDEKNNYNYKFNDILFVKGYLQIPNNNTIPNTFNYKAYLNNRNIEYILNINEMSLYKKNYNIFYSIKNKVYNRISKISNSEYIYSFLLGNSNYIDEYDYNIFKSNGILHLFSISSIHISIYIKFLSILLKKIIKNQNILFMIIIVYLFFLLFISSYTISMLKAVIYYILSILNKKYKITNRKINILILTFIFLILINPRYINYIGFKYSFVISFFILIYLENNKSLSVFNISLVAMLASFPILINTSYEINILSFIISIIFIPIVSFLLIPLCILVFLIPYLSFILSILLSIVKSISIFFSSFSIILYFAKISNVNLVVYYLLLFLLIKRYKNMKLFLIILIIFLYFKQDNKVIYFTNVNQGDSSLIIINKKSVLIDTGGIQMYEKEEWEKKKRNYNLMVSNLIPFYKSVGLKEIKYLVLTHGDFDHMGWSINLVNNFRVENVIFNCGEYNDLEKELIKVLDKKKIPYNSCIRELNIDNNKLYFLQTKEYDNENDNSNVIYTDLNGYKFMFMGDASTTTEKEILNKYNLPAIDVLKVGHHGSKTSSSEAFINEINPRYSIISVGKNNRYGHPNKEILDNLKDSKIYRTDEDGSIIFKIKNNKLKIETCTP